MKDLYSYILEKHNFANNGDEFYTKEKDIRKVLDEYNFKGKIVYCNCDNPSFSNFWKVFHDDFNKLGLKNSRVAVCGRNRYEWVVSHLSNLFGGIISVPIDKELQLKIYS